MAISHGRHAGRTASIHTVDTKKLEKELAKTRSEIRTALREKRQLPGEIQNAAELADEILTVNEFELKRLRSREERFSGLAAELEELESGPLGPFSDERTERYLGYLEELEMCAEEIELLQEEIDFSSLQLEELDAEEAQLDLQLDTLTDRRDHLVWQRDTLIIEALPIEPGYYDLVRVKPCRNGQIRVCIGREDIPGTYAIYHHGKIIIPKRFMEQIDLLHTRDGAAAD